MPLPSGITLATVTWGPWTSFFGKAGSATITVKPVLGGNAISLVWTATGETIGVDEDTYTVAAGEVGTFQVPHVDQPGFRNGVGAEFTMWAYEATAQIRFAGSSKTLTLKKTFQPLSSLVGALDLDLVPDGTVGAPVSTPTPQVLSVKGLTGDIDIVEGDNITIEVVDQTIVITGEAGSGGGGTGEDGRGITSISKTDTSGLVDTYTITYSDATTSTFTVTNGAAGTDGEDGLDGDDAPLPSFQFSATHLQYRLGTGPWNNLATIASLTGPSGASAINDSGVDTDEVWSSSKVSNELGLKVSSDDYDELTEITQSAYTAMGTGRPARTLFFLVSG